MRAVLLCAGFATRLHPVTRDSPKPLLEVGGRPILEDLVEQILAAGGPRDITLVSNARFADHFRRWAGEFGGRHPEARLRVLDDGATSDANRLGAVGDLAFALERREPGGPVLVAAGDNLFRFPLGDFLADHAARPRNLILAHREPDLARRQRSGVCLLDDSRRVVRFVEKPAVPPSEWCCPPLYAFEEAALARLPEFLASSPEADAPGTFLAWLVEREAVHAHEMRGTRLDIGDLETWHTAETWLSNQSNRESNRGGS